MESRGARVARNEALFREVNERIKNLAEGLETLILMCECGDLGCKEVIEMTPPEYEAVRVRGDLFFLVPGHEDLALDRVIERTARFLVVEKVGEGGDVARDLDPRS
jgi:hypothetical protein